MTYAVSTWESHSFEMEHRSLPVMAIACESNLSHRVTKLKGLPYMTATKCLDFFTPLPPLSKIFYVVLNWQIWGIIWTPSPLLCGRHIWKPPKCLRLLAWGYIRKRMHEVAICRIENCLGSNILQSSNYLSYSSSHAASITWSWNSW